MVKKGVVFFVFALFLIGFINAADYYVSNSGCSDSNPGTEAQPWCTIQKAANMLQEGETVYVKDGIYYEDVDMIRSGSAGNYITFMNYPGDNPVVDGSQTSDDKLVNWPDSDVDYVIWDGIDVRNGVKVGVWIHGEGNILRNSRVYNHGSHTGSECTACTGVSVIESNNCLVENNEIFHNGWNGVAVSNSDNVITRNNDVHDNTYHMGIQIVRVDDNSILSNNNKVLDNYVYSNRNGIYVVRQENAEISGNVIYDNLHSGIDFNVMGAGQGSQSSYSSYTTVSHNTLVGCQEQNAIKNSKANYLTVKNNIIAYNSGDDLNFYVRTGHDIDYNLYYDSVSFSWSSTYGSLSSFQSATGQEDHGISANPLFKDRNNDDYSFQQDSPACGAGEGGTDIGAIPCESTLPTCQTSGYQCCSSCSSDPHPEYDGDCTSQVCCSACSVQAFLPDQIVEAEDGTITSPMQIFSDSSASGGEYVSTPSWYDGKVSFTFDIPTAGDYYIEARTLSADTGSNSFYVGIDGEAANGDDYYTWDSFISSDFIWENVSLRGENGTLDNPNYDPMVWSLSSGAHVFSFYGREPNTMLDSFVLKAVVVSDCSSGADSDGDSVVSISELISFISSWKLGGVTISELLNGISEWKDGC